MPELADIHDIVEHLRKHTLGGEHDEGQVVDALVRVLDRRPDLRKQLKAADVAFLRAKRGNKGRYAFDESQHPRGQPENAGEFATKPGGGTKKLSNEHRVGERSAKFAVKLAKKNGAPLEPIVFERLAEQLKGHPQERELLEQVWAVTQGQESTQPTQQPAQQTAQPAGPKYPATKDGFAAATNELLTDVYHRSGMVPLKDVAASLGISHEQADTMALEMWRDGTLRYDKRENGDVTVEKGDKFPNLPVVSPLSSEQQTAVRGEIASEFQRLLQGEHNSSGLVPIHKVRAAIAAKFGPEAAKQSAFNEIVLDMWRNKEIDLEGLSDLSKATRKELDDSIQGGRNGAWFYLEPVRGARAAHYARQWNDLRAAGSNVSRDEITAAADDLAGTGVYVAWNASDESPGWEVVPASVVDAVMGRYAREEPGGGVMFGGEVYGQYAKKPYRSATPTSLFREEDHPRNDAGEFTRGTQGTAPKEENISSTTVDMPSQSSTIVDSGDKKPQGEGGKMDESLKAELAAIANAKDINPYNEPAVFSRASEEASRWLKANWKEWRRMLQEKVFKATPKPASSGQSPSQSVQTKPTSKPSKEDVASWVSRAIEDAKKQSWSTMVPDHVIERSLQSWVDDEMFRTEKEVRERVGQIADSYIRQTGKPNFTAKLP